MVVTVAIVSVCCSEISAKFIINSCITSGGYFPYLLSFLVLTKHEVHNTLNLRMTDSLTWTG